MFDWKSTLGAVAPLIASAIGTPVAGVAVAVGLRALGITPADDPGEHAAQLKTAVAGASTDDLLKLKAADNDFEIQMGKLGLEVKALDQKDRDSARVLATANSVPQIVLSVVYTLSYAGVMYLFMTGGVSVQDGQQVLFGSLIGILTAAQVQILNFWFGSSAGSKEKTQHMTGAR